MHRAALALRCSPPRGAAAAATRRDRSTRSHHRIAEDQPGLVISAIRQVVSG
jgi:hypothetical protein